MGALRYLMMARKVHDAMLLLNAAAALYTSFIATCCMYPHFGVVVHPDSPADEALGDVWTGAGSSELTLFLVLCVVAGLCTRRMLAEYWLAVFLTYYGPRRLAG
jgi:hypothetical protein